MAIEAHLADGRILEFLDGTDPSVVQATVMRVIAETAPPAGPVAPYSTMDNIKTAIGIESITLVLLMLVGWGFFTLFFRRLWRKPRISPHQTGLWWGSNLVLLAIIKAAAGLFTVFFLIAPSPHGRGPTVDALLHGTIGAAGFFVLGYVVGWIFRRLKPLPSTSVETPAKRNLNESNALPTNAMYAQAMTELEAQSSTVDRGLWVKCFAKANGNEAIAKAGYLRERAIQLAEQDYVDVAK